MDVSTTDFDRGFLRGPNEADSAFVQRKNFLLSKRPELTLASYPKVLDLTERLYGVRPDWLEIKKQKPSWLPWIGAACCIEGQDVWIEVGALPTWAGYSEEEVLAHEAIHACRMAFDGPYEECLAYQSSTGLRRYLGPIVDRPWQGVAFILTLWIGLAAYSVLDVAWLLLLPLSLFLLGMSRLIVRQRRFAKAFAIFGKQVLAKL